MGAWRYLKKRKLKIRRLSYDTRVARGSALCDTASGGIGSNYPPDFFLFRKTMKFLEIDIKIVFVIFIILKFIFLKFFVYKIYIRNYYLIVYTMLTNIISASIIVSLLVFLNAYNSYKYIMQFIFYLTNGWFVTFIIVDFFFLSFCNVLLKRKEIIKDYISGRRIFTISILYNFLSLSIVLALSIFRL